jgi:hypothetical protein
MRQPAFISFGSVAPAVLAGVLFALLAPGCSNQGEGEFCDVNAGAIGGDCADGLECVSAPGLSASPGPSPYRCCPVPGGATPTTSECSNNPVGVDASTEVPEASDDGATTGSDAADAASAVVEAAGPASDGAVAVESSTQESGSSDATSSDASDAAHE